MAKKLKSLWTVLILVALVVAYYWPQWTAPLPLQVEEIDLNEPEPYKSKEECYKAAEKYINGCIIRTRTGRDPCVIEQYCDSRGCC